MQSFILPANGAATPKSIERKRKMAEAMLANGMDASPIASPWQGAARMANALVGGLSSRKADKQETEGSMAAKEALIKALNGGDKASMIDALSNPFMSSAGMSMIGSQWDRMNQPPPNPELKDLGNGQFMQYDPRDPQGSQEMFSPEGYQPKQPELPTGVREYEYAKQQGFPGTFQQWEETKRSNMVMQSDGQGGFTFQQGPGAKALTESQSKDTNYAVRAEGAAPILNKYEKALTELGSAMGGEVPYVGNYLKSQDYQLAEQAGNEFLSALLRKDSGATITPQEQALYGSIFLPRPGDEKNPEIIAQKQAARRRAIEGINAGLPATAIAAKEKALAEGQAQPIPQPMQQPQMSQPSNPADPLGLR